MSILQITTNVTGLSGVNPQIIYIDTNDTVATVATAGYLNGLKTEGFTFSNKQFALVNTTDSSVQWFNVSIAAATGVITLISNVNPGDVLLPVVANHIAAFSAITGQIGDLAGPIISKGVIQSGVNNSSTGGFIAIPAGNNQGQFRITPVANAGGFNSILSNTAIGQATTYSLPDPGGAAANVLLNNSAGTQTIATGNLALTLGNITVAAGSISATLGALSAGTTVTAGTGITATTGNITASAGNVIAGSAVPAAGTFVSFPAASGGAADKLVVAATTSGGNFTTTITNRAMGQSSTISFVDPANANGTLLIAATTTPFVTGNFPVNSGTAGLMVDSGLAGNKVLTSSFATPDVNANIINFNVTVGQAALAAGGHVALITSSGAKQYKILNLFINAGGTNFSGGGGDRLGQVSDGTTVYSIIPAAQMQTLPGNIDWGTSASFPYPAGGVAANTSTVAGANLFFSYNTGTADYTAGSVVVSGTAVRVA